MPLRKSVFLSLIVMIICRAEESPTDKLITSSDQIYIVTIDSIVGIRRGMTHSQTLLSCTVELVLKGKTEKGQHLEVEWMVPVGDKITDEEKRRRAKEGEKFIIFVNPDITTPDKAKDLKYVLADVWLGFQPNSIDFSNYIMKRVKSVGGQ
jgi:hypothetical protein